MSEFLNAEPQRHQLSRWYGLVAVPLLVFCFFAIEHRWDASLTNQESTGLIYDGTENVTADRSSQLNAGSSSARLMLAGFAMLGLVLPCGSRFKINSPVFWCIAIYVFGMLMTYFWAKEPSHTGFKLGVLVIFTFTAFGISRQLTLAQLGRVFACASVAFIFIGVFAEFRFGTLRIVGDYRFTGSLHPNTQAAFGSIVCFAAALFYRKEKPSTLLLALSFFLIGFTCILMTKSRTSMAAMIVGLTAFYAIRFRGMKRLMLISIVTCGLAMGGLMVTVLSNQFKQALGNAAALGRSDDLGQLSGRLPLWEELLEWVAREPIFGHGFNSMWTSKRVEELGDMFRWEIPHAHNMYIDVLLDAGIIGLVMFLLYIFVGLVTSAKQYLRTGDDGAAFCFALTFYALLHGFGESFFKQQIFVNLCLLALLFRLAWYSTDEEKRESESDDSIVESDETLVAV